MARPSSAAAQDGQTEAARAQLLERAEDAYQHGDHAAALDFARRAGEIRMTPSVLLMLAQEHNALGHTLDALSAIERCMRDLEADHHVPHRRRMLHIAEPLRTSLRARVGYVTVQVPAPPPDGLQVRVQGGELVRALWNVPYPTLPGAVVIEASAASGTFRREVTLSAGQTEAVTVSLSAAPPTAPPPPAPTVPATPAPTAPTERPPAAPLAPPPPHPPPVPAAPTGPGVGPWVVVGAGAASLGASLAFFLLRQGAITDRDAACAPSAACPDPAFTTAQTLHDRAVLYNTLSGVTLGVGAAAVAGGVMWYVLARPSRTTPTRTTLRWYITPGRDGAAFGVQGAL